MRLQEKSKQRYGFDESNITKPKEFLPDLMAFKNPPALNEVQFFDGGNIQAAKRVYIKTVRKHERDFIKSVVQDKPKEKIVRPPAVYDNIPTPYGIATEMLVQQLKKSG